MIIKSEKDFEQIAETYYDNPQCFAFSEFEQDLKRFSHVAKLIEKYGSNISTHERLILNHIIILHNLFGRFTADGLFYKTCTRSWPILKTFLSFLKYVPQESEQFQIEDDQRLMETLNSL